MTKEIFEEIKTLLETKEELERKEIMLTSPADEIYLAEIKYSVGCIPRAELKYSVGYEKEKLNSDELSVLRKYINEEIDRIKERLKELGYYD